MSYPPAASAPSTIPDLLAARVMAAPDAPLLIDALTAEERSYGTVARQALRWARFFRDRGLGQGSRAAVVLPNCLDWAELFLGAAIGGVTLCPYNPALPPAELAALILRYGGLLVLTTASRADSLRAALAVPVFTVGPWAELPVGLPAPAAAPEPVSPDTLVVLIMTSGTTGGVKACRISHRNVCWTSAQAAAAFHLGPDSRYLTPLPLYHINAQVIGLLAAVQGGGAVALGPRLPAPKLWEAAECCRATGMSAVPTIVYDLLDGPGAPPPGLRFLVCSSAALAPGPRRQFEERFGIPILVCYGLSEAGCYVSYGGLSLPAPPASVGKPLGCEVRILGGQVLVRGPGVFEGYDGDETASGAALRDGWLLTGDCGYLDEAGFLYLQGRLKDIINRGGEKIAPDAVEAVLRDCPGLREVAVFAVPDGRLGEEVAAAVVFEPGCELSDEDLWDFCQDRLAEFETPRSWVRLEALPRGATGKVLRPALRERHAGEAGREGVPDG